MNLEISHQLAVAILNYLQTKPYNEVHVLIAELTKLKQLPPPDQAGDK